MLLWGATVLKASATSSRPRLTQLSTNGRHRAFSICFRHREKLSASASASDAQQKTSDPRLKSSDRVIIDDFANLREEYQAPKNPIILAHGLFGFDELHLAGAQLPGLHYWRGITEALAAKNVEVITATVPASGSIEARAAKLAQMIETKAKGKKANIIAHSMGGLDARYMISRLAPPNVQVLSLTTIATPHRGSAFADYVFEQIGPYQIPKIYKVMEYFGMETGAFSQLTRKYMEETFNPATPDVDGVHYYSYGATFVPNWWSMFWQSQKVVLRAEGPNDGLVSADSSRWGQYQGTLEGVSHLDLINWTNRLRWWMWEMTGNKRNFNAVAFYLSIADMLAKKGL